MKLTLRRVRAAIVAVEKQLVLDTVSVYLMVAPCINNIKHFIVQLMHTNYKNP